MGFEGGQEGPGGDADDDDDGLQDLAVSLPGLAASLPTADLRFAPESWCYGTSVGLTAARAAVLCCCAVQDEHEDSWQDVGKRGKGRKKGRPGSGGAANRFDVLPRRARGA